MRHKIITTIALSSLFFLFQCSSADDLNKKDEKGKTPLHYAVIEKDHDKVADMVEKGADPNIKDRGWSSLHYAVYKGDLKTVQLLIKNKADVQLASDNGWTPLHVAAFFTSENKDAIMSELKKAGANINAQSKAGKTPLYLAVKKNDTKKVKWLIANGADKSIASNDNITPLAWAKENNNQELIELLTEK